MDLRLSSRQQSCTVSGQFSASLTLNTGAPQECLLSPVMFTLFTNDCVFSHDSVLILNFQMTHKVYEEKYFNCDTDKLWFCRNMCDFVYVCVCACLKLLCCRNVVVDV